MPGGQIPTPNLFYVLTVVSIIYNIVIYIINNILLTEDLVEFYTQFGWCSFKLGRY